MKLRFSCAGSAGRQLRYTRIVYHSFGSLFVSMFVHGYRLLLSFLNDLLFWIGIAV